MPSQYAKYEMKDGVTELAARFFNAVFGDIDTRLVSLEDLKVSWQTAIDELRQFGMERINSALQANYDEIAALTTSAETQLADIEQRVTTLAAQADTAVAAANEAVATANSATSSLEDKADAAQQSAAAAADSAAAAVQTAADAHNTALLLAVALG